MIILFLINSVFYILITIFLLSFYYGYKKELEDYEKRLLHFEKRVADNTKNIEYYEKLLKEIVIKLYDERDKKNKPFKEVLDMACKKGRGGRKK